MNKVQEESLREQKKGRRRASILEIARDLHRMQTDQMDSHKTQTTLLRQLVGKAK